ncbi:c-type cytochrome [Piscinibacter sp. XHJ-5]|uniref:c-type cytochrome n=1 Tax=Piscinibacter sp. XHJ-5 TaxID=3037797 RepID=UPI002452E88A|nr:c-type cytochrome [Piscinibacter sp. XHJ-5]
MDTRPWVALGLAAVIALPARADDNVVDPAPASKPSSATEGLAKSKNCLSCHALATRIVGPAYKDVAARYAGQADAEDKLVQKVLKGGAGAWGQIPMPPNTQVSQAEARALVKWVLQQ